MSQSSSGIQVSLTTTDGTAVVVVAGEIDMHTSPRLRALLLEHAGKLTGPLLIDLSAVGHMDSSGVGTLVFIKREIERAGRRLVLIGLQPRVRGVFEITNLDRFFTIARNVAEAVGT